LKVAVVGAGIFGCMAAIKLSGAGYKVTLFEKNHSVLSCASGINQYRLHRGYHYPRSKETVEYVKQSSILFEEEFPSAICRDGFDRYYAVSSKGSLITPDQYLTFLESNSLEYEKVDKLPLLVDGSTSLIVKVSENGFDPIQLYMSVVSKLAKSKVLLRTNRVFTLSDKKEFDIVVNATYSDLNMLLEDKDRLDYQYELCEKPVVQLPAAFSNKSVVVIDGEYCCVDPIGESPTYQVIGHVREAIHDRHIGLTYIVPDEYKSVINRGRTYSNLSRFDRMWKGFTEYFNADSVAYKGSMYTVRTVLPKHEHDDARPSNIIKHNDNMYSIFSGKIGTCVDIANNLVNQI